MCADCIVFVTFCKYIYRTTNEWFGRNITRYMEFFLEICYLLTYKRRYSCSLLCATVGCCLLYPHCIGFAFDAFHSLRFVSIPTSH